MPIQLPLPRPGRAVHWHIEVRQGIFFTESSGDTTFFNNETDEEMKRVIFDYYVSIHPVLCTLRKSDLSYKVQLMPLA